MKKLCQNFREELISHWDSTGEISASLTESKHMQRCDECREFLAEFGTFSTTLEESKSSPVQLNTAKFRANVWEEIDRRTTSTGLWQQVFRPAVLAPVLAILIAVSLYWLWPENGKSPEQRMDQKILYSYAVDVLEPSDLPESTIELVAQSEFDESIKEYMLQQENYSVIQEIYESEDVWTQVLTELNTMQL